MQIFSAQVIRWEEPSWAGHVSSVDLPLWVELAMKGGLPFLVWENAMFHSLYGSEQLFKICFGETSAQNIAVSFTNSNNLLLAGCGAS